MYGASPMSPTRLVEGLEKIGPVFTQLYGQTEGYPISVLRRADHDAANCGALRLLRPSLHVGSGRPDWTQDDQPVAPGEVGEITARAPHIMRLRTGIVGRADGGDARQ